MGAAPGVAPVRSRYATLTVTVRPEPPVILQGALINTQEDRLIILECVSRGGKPAAEVSLTFYSNGYCILFAAINPSLNASIWSNCS